MFLSKHHYAIEMAKKNNTVFFLNPPVQRTSTGKSISIGPSNVHPNLFFIDHALSFPYILRFRVLWLFHFLMKYHVRRIEKEIGRPIDIVWSFDIGNLYPLSYFRKSALKVFHPVDEPLNKHAFDAAEGAEIIFSVTKEILNKYSAIDVSRHLISHGVSEYFIANDPDVVKDNDQIHIGFSGNLLRQDIDRKILLDIITQNHECVFEFWGSFSVAQSNVGGSMDTDTADFIDKLKNLPNCKLHGVVSSSELATHIRSMDAFLICYDVQKDQSKGTNYHKVMEYLGTGKVIVSNNITSYSKHANLVQMVEERTNNSDLPSLFRNVIENLNYHNSVLLQKERIAYAENNTYEKQMARIEGFIAKM
ncbi:MAG: hypothetical protein HOP08_16950 [Cyclobacteriaceae bacterium]|nr:hypothetical protein [Cyclobacteriaceae bacterium]